MTCLGFNKAVCFCLGRLRDNFLLQHFADDENCSIDDDYFGRYAALAVSAHVPVSQLSLFFVLPGVL